VRYLSIHNYPAERTRVTYPNVWWDGAFSTEELDKIEHDLDAIGTERAKVLGQEKHEDPDFVDKIRRCGVKFHSPSADNGWIFQRLNDVISKLNAQFYGFDLNGYEAFQYTVYDSSEQGMYDWHMDSCLGTDGLPADMNEPRKLSLSMLVNDDFQGGEFQISLGDQTRPTTLDIPRGRIMAFPSFVAHRVKPVTQGYRKSIVVWVTGPKFR
jgi:PKHD-type hydroxylase